MSANLRIPQHDVLTLARITRGQYRQWEMLFSPALSRRAKRPAFTAAETLAMCVFAELMRALDAGTHHLDPISDGFFREICSSDWRRFEHRILVLTLISEPSVSGSQQVHATFTTVSKSEPLQVANDAVLVLLDLAPFVQRINRFLTGVNPDPDVEQMSLLGGTRGKVARTRLPPRAAPVGTS